MRDRDVIRVLNWIADKHFYHGLKEDPKEKQLWLDNIDNPELTTEKLLKKAKRALKIK